MAMLVQAFRYQEGLCEECGEWFVADYPGDPFCDDCMDEEWGWWVNDIDATMCRDAAMRNTLDKYTRE